MDCRQAQRYWDDLAEGRLETQTAEALRRHLADCTDCRVGRQRAARLQQLLALKRYETPGPEYFAGFVQQLHRRLDPTANAPSWWERWLDRCSWDRPAWRLGLGAAATASLLVAAGFYWPNTRSEPLVADQSSTRSPQTVAAPATVAAVTGPASSLAAADVLLPVGPVVSNQPRYVLDRFSLTPASYEPGSVRF